MKCVCNKCGHKFTIRKSTPKSGFRCSKCRSRDVECILNIKDKSSEKTEHLQKVTLETVQKLIEMLREELQDIANRLEAIENKLHLPTPDYRKMAVKINQEYEEKHHDDTEILEDDFEEQKRKFIEEENKKYDETH